MLKSSWNKWELRQDLNVERQITFVSWAVVPGIASSQGEWVLLDVNRMGWVRRNKAHRQSIVKFGEGGRKGVCDGP